MTELELVRAVLASPPARARELAGDLARKADGVGPGWVADPEVAVRHEQANGPAGASTDVIGAQLTLHGLGLERVEAEAAARIRRRAAPLWREARRLEWVCAIRGHVVDLHAALAGAAAARSGQVRLDSLFDTLVGLAEAGEASGFDRDLAALARAEHHLQHVAGASHAAELRAWFEARLGHAVPAVVLMPIGSVSPGEPHPAVRALELGVQAAERERASAQRGALPDVTMAGGARWDAMPDGTQRESGYEVGAAVTVPVFERNRPRVQESRAAAATARAALELRRAEIRAASQAAQARVVLLESSPAGPEPEAVWEAARLRYLAGESTLEALLLAASRVEDATLARIERARQLRRARLAHACALGRLPEAGFDALVREAP